MTRRKYEDARALLDLLCEKFPKIFVCYEQRRRPLKVGIHADLVVALEGVATPAELRLALRTYTANRVYRSKLRDGATRYDLNGMPVCVVVWSCARAGARARQSSARCHHQGPAGAAINRV